MGEIYSVEFSDRLPHTNFVTHAERRRAQNIAANDKSSIQGSNEQQGEPDNHSNDNSEHFNDSAENTVLKSAKEKHAGYSSPDSGDDNQPV